MKKIIKILILLTLTACNISSTHYKGKYVIKVVDSYQSDKENLTRNINQIAHLFNLTPDKNVTNNDTLSFFNPPYHYIQFSFNKTRTTDSIEVILNYEGRLATQQSTDSRYFGIKKCLDSLYGDQLKYTLLIKNYNP